MYKLGNMVYFMFGIGLMISPVYVVPTQKG